jgi:hypothetical protein
VSWDEINLKEALEMAIVKKPKDYKAGASTSSTSTSAQPAAGEVGHVSEAEEPEDDEDDDPSNPTAGHLLELVRLWALVIKGKAEPDNPFYMPKNFGTLSYQNRRDFARKVLRMLLQALLGMFPPSQ